MLATLYSDDTESAKNGGELGFVNRGDLVPSFERAAFRLKEGEISEVVESRYGFHLIQLIKRRGNQINVRHILLKNKVTSTALFNAKTKIDNIKQEIISGKKIELLDSIDGDSFKTLTWLIQGAGSVTIEVGAAHTGKDSTSINLK